MIHIGMDLHQKTTTWFACDGSGQRLGSGKVDSSPEGWGSIVERFGSELQVVIETGSTTWWCVDVLRERGLEPVVVDARQFKLIADSRKKSDRRDARSLAVASQTGLAAQCSVEVPSERARRGRSLLQARKTIVDQGTASRNAIKGLLRGCGVTVPRALWRHSERLEQALADQPRIPEWMRPLLQSHFRVWLATQVERHRLDALIATELEQWPDAAHLRSIPGVGPLVLLAIVSALDDPRRFARGRQVASYAGLPPSVRDSGQSKRRGRITRQGRSLLRHALTQASHSALRGHKLSDKHRAWVRRIDARRGRQIAAVALARKLLVIAHQMWLTGELYDPQHVSQPSQLAA